MFTLTNKGYLIAICENENLLREYVKHLYGLSSNSIDILCESGSIDIANYGEPINLLEVDYRPLVTRKFMDILKG